MTDQVYERHRRHESEVEPQLRDDDGLKLEDTILGDFEGVSGDGGEVGEFGDGDFLVLGGHEDDGDGKKLEVIFGCVHFSEKPVHKINSQKASLKFKFEGFTNNENPLDDFASEIVINLFWVFDGGGHIPNFLLPQVLVNLLAVLYNFIR